MHSYISNIGLKQNSLKRLDLMKNGISFTFEETGSAPNIYQKLAYQHMACAVYITSGTFIRSNKAHKNHMELIVFFLLVLFSVCLLFSFCLFVFLPCILYNIRRKHLKCSQICKLSSWFCRT